MQTYHRIFTGKISRFSKGIHIGNFTFRPRLFTTCLAIIVFSLLLKLGYWQLDRARYKESLIERHQLRTHMPPLTLPQLDLHGEDIDDYPVVMTGTYEPHHTFLLDNKTENGIAGYHVLTVFKAGNNQHILINRGWIPQGKTRAILPTFQTTEEQITINGRIYRPDKKAFVLKEDSFDTVTWPLLIQRIDFTAMSNIIKRPIEPYTVRLKPENTSSFIRNWHIKPIQAGKHKAYALQWFAMALALFVIYVSTNTSRRTPRD